MRCQSLLTPTSSPGFNWLGSISPGVGKYVVCRVVVLTTTDYSFSA